MVKQKQSLYFADALFKVALQQNKLNDYFEQFTLFVDLLYKKDTDLYLFLSSFSISNNEKYYFISKNFSSVFSLEFINFIFIVLNKSCHNLFYFIFENYQSLVDFYNNFVRAKVFSPYYLDVEILDNLSRILENKFSKKFFLSNIIDNTIIGGCIITFEDRVINLSLKYHLDSIYKNIISSKIKG